MLLNLFEDKGSDGKFFISPVLEVYQIRRERKRNGLIVVVLLLRLRASKLTINGVLGKKVMVK